MFYRVLNGEAMPSGLLNRLKTFCKKCAPLEIEQRFKLWEENVNIQEKQAIPYWYGLHKEF